MVKWTDCSSLMFGVPGSAPGTSRGVESASRFRNRPAVPVRGHS